MVAFTRKDEFVLHSENQIGAATREAGVNDHLSNALAESEALHNLIDELEARLFGQGPTEVKAGGSGPGGSPSIAGFAQSVRHRLESAVGRLGKITQRL